MFFSFITLVSTENQLIALWEFPNFFSLAIVNIFSYIQFLLFELQCVLGWSSLGRSCLGLSVLSALGGLFPFPGDLPNPGIEPRSPSLQEDSLPAEPQGKAKYTVNQPFKASACSVAKSCLTLCDPVDCSPPDSSVYEISQARTLEWAVIPFSNKASKKVKIQK